MKKTLMILVALLLCLLTFPALADGDVPPSNLIAPGNRSFVEWRNGMRSGDYCLTYVSAGITPGTGCVYFSVTTEANQISDTVGASIYVQQWRENKWNDYFSVGTYSDDSDSCTYSRTLNVTPGYYYRLEVYHYGVLLTERDSAATYTKSVYVN